jgi:precorrin-6B methylase 2
MRITNGQQLLEMMRDYQAPCILAAAVDLGVFASLSGDGPRSAREVALATQSHERGTKILLDALAALGLVSKSEDGYRLTDELAPLLTADSVESVLPMLRHQAVCLRRWAQLPWTVRDGSPVEVAPSLLGAEADQEAFIQAMHVVSRDMAPVLVPEIKPDRFSCVLDVGGASGSWTLAWLDVQPDARAIIFDLPHVIPLARARMAEAGVGSRVKFVEGDFYQDALPEGADLVWLSAIIHQNSREQNRALFARAHDALPPGKWIYIRDVVLDGSRTSPIAGALFAVNMLAATEGGNCYAFDEIAADLQQAGFRDVELVRPDEAMHSVVRARAG